MLISIHACVSSVSGQWLHLCLSCSPTVSAQADAASLQRQTLPRSTAQNHELLRKLSVLEDSLFVQTAETVSEKRKLEGLAEHSTALDAQIRQLQSTVAVLNETVRLGEKDIEEKTVALADQRKKIVSVVSPAL